MKTIITSILITILISTTLQAKQTCKNFNTQAEAQAYYDARLPNWKRLDGDKDGEPCECLRGGSAYDKPVCRRWRRKYGK